MRPALAFGWAALLAGCADLGGSGIGGGTIEGQVTAGPTCPVVQQGREAECADRPLATQVRAIDVADGEVAAETTSLPDGRFRLGVPAGLYVLEAGGAAALPSCQPEAAEVAAGAVTTVAISCDTGIR